MRKDVRLDLRIDLTAIRVVLRAGFRRDREALRHRHTGRGHLRQTGTLAAKRVAHRGLVTAECLTSFAEIVQVFFAHSFTSICKVIHGIFRSYYIKSPLAVL